MTNNSNLRILLNGVIKQNPVLVLVIGMCPALAITTSATNGLGMGLATAIVLLSSNILISILKKIIPDNIRIAAYVVIIALFVSIVEMFMQVYWPALHESLGIFVPLIVVNSMILGRAQAFVAENNVIRSAFDGLSMGIGFTLALTLLGSLREILGSGKVFGFALFPDKYGMLVFVFAPGAFIVLAYLIAIANLLKKE